VLRRGTITSIQASSHPSEKKVFQNKEKEDGRDPVLRKFGEQATLKCHGNLLPRPTVEG